MRCYRSARKIVVVTDSFKRTLTARGVPAEKIEVVKNGANRELFKPMPKDEALAERLGLKGKRVIGYIGTHGLAHKLDFICNVQRICRVRMTIILVYWCWRGKGTVAEDEGYGAYR